MISAEIMSILSNNTESFIGKVKANLDSSGTTATGESKKSLRYEIKEEGSKIVLTVFGKPYFAVVETGRKPGGGVSRAMIQNLTKWVAVRGLEEGMVWGIAKKIDKEGTKLFKSGGRKDIYTNEKQGFTDKVFDEVVKSYANDVFNKIILTFE
jgi:hypothetical protein